MKTLFKILFIIGISVIFSCAEDQDPCDIQHVTINGECIPDYIFPSNNVPKNGDKFYHKKYGVISYQNGHWFDEKNLIIADLETKTN